MVRGVCQEAADGCWKISQRMELGSKRPTEDDHLLRLTTGQQKLSQGVKTELAGQGDGPAGRKRAFNRNDAETRAMPRERGPRASVGGGRGVHGSVDRVDVLLGYGDDLLGGGAAVEKRRHGEARTGQTLPGRSNDTIGEGVGQVWVNLWKKRGEGSPQIFEDPGGTGISSRGQSTKGGVLVESSVGPLVS
eukprot:764267-Hanusia_phi.AAC.2